MIKSINIQNYKNLSGLTIPEFSRINLISGKNNVGKSSLLEALSLFIKDSSLFSIINSRGEFLGTPRDNYENKAELTKQNIEAISSLFTNRNKEIGNGNEIIINDGTETLSLSFVRYTEQEEENGGVSRKIDSSLLLDDYSIDDSHIGLNIAINNENKYLIPLNRRLDSFSWARMYKRNNISKMLLLSYNKQERISYLWDDITLTDKEAYVIQALQIIEPKIESLAFLEQSSSRSRYPVVKIQGINNRIPLRSMGDGINQILSIILALVNCDNGFVLIDEIDNGLHYTVQKQLWKVIFDLAVKLNIQVFATTHSSDCISSFGRVLNECENSNEGRYIRLEFKNGDIQPIEYNVEELSIVAAQNIEIR